MAERRRWRCRGCRCWRRRRLGGVQPDAVLRGGGGQPLRRPRPPQDVDQGGGDAQQPGAEQPAGEPVLEDLAHRQEEEAEWEYSRQVARRRLEQKLGSREAAEYLSEGEKDRPNGAPVLHCPAVADGGDHQQQHSRLARINSDVRIVSDKEDEESKDDRNLYIVLIRYLSIQWGIDLSKVAVLVGDKGDTDRERLLLGLHRKLVRPGLVSRCSEELLRNEDGFVPEDVVAMDSPNIVTLAEGQAAADILKAI